jgi:hypothetical protein
MCFQASLKLAGKDRGQFVEHLNQTKEAQQSAAKFIVVTVLKLVKSKTTAMLEVLFNKLASRARVGSGLALKY